MLHWLAFSTSINYGTGRIRGVCEKSANEKSSKIKQQHGRKSNGACDDVARLFCDCLLIDGKCWQRDASAQILLEY
jgi:hypothetical protein